MSGSYFDDETSDNGAFTGSVTNQVDASIGFNSGWAFDIPKTADTATTNAIQSQAPNTANNTVSGSDWSGFWQGVLGGAVKTATTVVAAKNGVIQTATTQPAVTPPPNPNRNILLLAVVIGVVLLATHKAA